MKKCWDTIKHDVYKLCQDFFDCAVDLTPINTSFITLVPKVSSLEQVNDYRPIYLLNSIIKIITKILADRLQLVILELIHLNQRHTTEEDIEHLFFSCPFATNCWLRLNIAWNLDLDLHQRVSQARNNFQHGFFMEVFLIGPWELWKVRNAVIFDNAQPMVHLWSVKFREQLLLHLFRFNNVIKDSVVSWLSSL
ncbi:hypothetical protein PVAP13_1NG224419 [Panicum virgatum]|uniref:Reverse transcriptase zinc-binding domain-containing protein n=1 Tax=Panicum virgatum TaxID=38727 RepID=A0A8T0WYS1_PANVG|nr:hypothetical protein PVAP13_1NG224419 [Panicum virgatum]